MRRKRQPSPVARPPNRLEGLVPAGPSLSHHRHSKPPYLLSVFTSPFCSWGHCKVKGFFKQDDDTFVPMLVVTRG